MMEKARKGGAWACARSTRPKSVALEEAVDRFFAQILQKAKLFGDQTFREKADELRRDQHVAFYHVFEVHDPEPDGHIDDAKFGGYVEPMYFKRMMCILQAYFPHDKIVTETGHEFTVVKVYARRPCDH